MPRPEFSSGQLFPFLGELKYFNFNTTHLKKIRFEIDEGFLIGFIPEKKLQLQTDKITLQRYLTQFYKQQA